jgi:hypothetical protein
MRLNPSFKMQPIVISTPTDAIRHLRDYFASNNLETLCEDEELRFSFLTAYEGVRLQVVAMGEPDMNRVVLATSLLDESQRSHSELTSLANHLNCRLAYTLVVIPDLGQRRVGFESYLLLADGTCLAAQVDFLASAHMGTVARILRPMARFSAGRLDETGMLQAMDLSGESREE